MCNHRSGLISSGLCSAPMLESGSLVPLGDQLCVGAAAELVEDSGVMCVSIHICSDIVAGKHKSTINIPLMCTTAATGWGTVVFTPLGDPAVLYPPRSPSVVVRVRDRVLASDDTVPGKLCSIISLGRSLLDGLFRNSG